VGRRRRIGVQSGETVAQVFEAGVEVCGINIGGLMLVVRGVEIEAEPVGRCKAGGER